jgi:hypothetical protein
VVRFSRRVRIMVRGVTSDLCGFVGFVLCSQNHVPVHLIWVDYIKLRGLILTILAKK